jgi:c-di-GMP-binding flagellar brake protein YcgR
MAKPEARDERRSSNRIDAHLAVEMSAQMPSGPLQMLTESINISTGGVYCSVKSEVPLLTKVDLNIQLPRFGTHKSTQVVRCEGLVVRCESAAKRSTAVHGARFDLACAFHNLDTETQGLINEFILWKLLRPAGL